MSKYLFVESTTVSVEKNLSKIQQMLADAGATAVMTEYDAGEPSGIAFRLKINEQFVSFRLPCRWRELRKAMNKRASSYGEAADLKAKRVAWRQLYWWTRAQLALIEAEMVKLVEVFLPYAQYPSGETVYERMEGKGMLALTDESANKGKSKEER